MTLNGLVMNVSSTAEQGVVGADTLLRFRQNGERVFARYAGGDVVRGCLAGRVSGSELTFRYAQIETSGEIHAGHSVCDIRSRPDGRTRIIEHFTWSTRSGSGVNVFDEITTDQTDHAGRRCADDAP